MKTVFRKINYDIHTGEPVSIDVYEQYTIEEFREKFPHIILYRWQVKDIPKYPYPMVINR